MGTNFYRYITILTYPNKKAGALLPAFLNYY